jgi:hypothetical protein
MWMDIGIVALLLFGVYAFTQIVGWETRNLSRRSMRRAEDLYGQFAGSLRRQRRAVREQSAQSPGEPPKDPATRA